MKLGLDDLIELERYYKVDSSYLFSVESFETAISLAKNDLPEVLNTGREYPVFPYYLVLAYLDGTYIKFSDLNEEDKIKKFNDTMSELESILHRGVTKQMIEFLNQSIKFNLPFKYRHIFPDCIKYSFNVEKNREDYAALCDMTGLHYERGEDCWRGYTLNVLFQ